MYDINIKHQLDLLHTNMKKHNSIKARTEIKNVIVFAQMSQKLHYDRKHHSMFLQMNDYALLRLHHDYFILFVKKKLDQQYVESFKILKKIERLTYQLNISQHWKVHSIFIIAQLKFALNFITNFFHRFRSKESLAIFVEDDTETMKSFELNKLLNKRTTRKERDLIIEYLVKWKDYESKLDKWLNTKKLCNATELIKDYENAVVVFKKHNIIDSFRLFKQRQRERWSSFTW